MSILPVPTPHGFAGCICTWEFWVNDETTGVGIKGVRIKIWWDDPLMGHVEYSTYTDYGGYASIKTVCYQWTYITLEHPQYETSERGPFDSRVGYLGFTFDIVPSAVPPNGITLTLYAQANRKWWQITGSVDLPPEHYTLTRDYPQKVVIWGLEPNRSYTLYASGFYIKGPFDYPPFDWSFSLTTGTQDVEYWLDVMTGEIHYGLPPKPPPTPDDILAWILKYWYVIPLGFVGIVFAPEIIRGIKGTIYALKE